MIVKSHTIVLPDKRQSSRSKVYRLAFTVCFGLRGEVESLAELVELATCVRELIRSITVWSLTNSFAATAKISPVSVLINLAFTRRVLPKSVILPDTIASTPNTRPNCLAEAGSTIPLERQFLLLNHLIEQLSLDDFEFFGFMKSCDQLLRHETSKVCYVAFRIGELHDCDSCFILRSDFRCDLAVKFIYLQRQT